MSKKERELQILKKIYNSAKINIKISERPDFIIKTPELIFGVEVTEYYFNKSSARLKNYRGYKERILNSEDNSVLDKEDVGLLSRHQLYIKTSVDSKYKYLFDYVGIKYDKNLDFNVKPSYDTVEDQIINIINIKNIKSKDYKKNAYNELIIQCNELLPIGYIKKMSMSMRILNCVNESKFKRLYFLVDRFLCVYGEKPSENLDLYNIGGVSNE